MCLYLGLLEIPCGCGIEPLGSISHGVSYGLLINELISHTLRSVVRAAQAIQRIDFNLQIEVHARKKQKCMSDKYHRYIKLLFLSEEVLWLLQLKLKKSYKIWCKRLVDTGRKSTLTNHK